MKVISDSTEPGDKPKQVEKEAEVELTPEEKIRKEIFPALAIFEKRKFVPRESLLFETIVQNKSQFYSLRGFYHMIVVTCTFYIITHPIVI